MSTEVRMESFLGGGVLYLLLGLAQGRAQYSLRARLGLWQTLCPSGPVRVATANFHGDPSSGGAVTQRG